MDYVHCCIFVAGDPNKFCTFSKTLETLGINNNYPRPMSCWYKESKAGISGLCYIYVATFKVQLFLVLYQA